MHPIIKILSLQLPVYGIISIVSLMILMLSGWFILRKSEISILDGMVLGAYGLLGAYIGSKLLFVIQNRYYLPLKSLDDLLLIMQAGGSAYGGILLGILFGLFGAWIHKINYKIYVNKIIYLLPLCHGIWKIGCFCSGCCYGIPYAGIGNVIFLESTIAPAGIKLFPVQLVEAVFLFSVAIFLMIYKKRSISLYLLIYSIGRFFIEFFRNREVKNILLFLSDVHCDYDIYCGNEIYKDA